jgi:hypothetical protein
MRKIDWLRWGLTAACLGWTLPAAAQVPAVTGARSAPLKQPHPGRDVQISVEDHNRFMEIRIELAWLSDPLTFPCLLVAHVDSTTLQATGYVPDRRVHDRALQIARLHCPMTVVDNLRERPQATTRLARIEPAQLQPAALSSLQASFPEQRHLFKVQCDTAGRVKVSGFVASFEEKLAVSQTLRRVHGCSLVMNETHVTADLHQLANAKRVTPIKAAATPPSSSGIQRTQYVPPVEQTGLVAIDPRQSAKAKSVNPIQAPATPPPSPGIQRTQYVTPVEQTGPVMIDPHPSVNVKRLSPIEAPAPPPPSSGIQRTQYLTPVEQTAPVTIDPHQSAQAKRLNPIQAPASPPPPSGAIQRIQYLVPDTKQTAQPANGAAQARSADLGKAYVSHGTVIVPDRETIAPAPKAALLQQRLAQACNIHAGRIKLETRPGNVLDIQLTVATQAEYHRLIQRISQMPDVVPYRLHIRMKKAE